MLCFIVLCYVMLGHIILYYIMLCYIRLYCIMLHDRSLYLWTKAAGSVKAAVIVTDTNCIVDILLH